MKAGNDTCALTSENLPLIFTENDFEVLWGNFRTQTSVTKYAQRPLNFYEMKYEDSSVRNDMCVQTGAQKAIAPSSLPPTK